MIWIGKSSQASRAKPKAGTSRYARWARTEHSEATRIVTVFLASPVFLLALPLLVAGAGPRLDRRLGLPPARIGRGKRVLAPRCPPIRSAGWSTAARTTTGP